MGVGMIKYDMEKIDTRKLSSEAQEVIQKRAIILLKDGKKKRGL